MSFKHTSDKLTASIFWLLPQDDGNRFPNSIRMMTTQLHFYTHGHTHGVLQNINEKC
jgi:hypothetical protein